MRPLEYPLVDLALSRRLERAEGHANARFVESRARITPAVGATWREAGGAYAMFDGAGSPLTQTFGLGLFEPVTNRQLAELETFFFERHADAFHEVSPLADPSALALLNARGYRPCEFTSVTFQPLSPELPSPDGGSPVAVRIATEADLEAWAHTALRGWSEFPEVLEFMAAFGPMAAGADDAYPFLAEMDGVAVATGMLAMHDGVALLAGASTVPEARGRGAQRALLQARLHYAASAGCTVAMMCASPGGGSQRNAERSGFRIAYTRIKWHKAHP
jgi:GNAT superfamily N-acetyltransferase